MIGIENISKSNHIDMKRINEQKQKARQFIFDNKSKIITDALPCDLREEVKSGVLDTKLYMKIYDGSGEKSEVR